jgi:hypothetical protein
MWLITETICNVACNYCELYLNNVMVSVLASSAVNRGFETRSDKTRAKKLAFVTFPIRAKTGWLGIRIMCPSRATCISTNCYFSELAIYKSN